MGQAMRLNPRYPPIYLWQLGWAYSLLGRYPETITTMKEFLSRSPNYFAAYRMLAVSYREQWAFQQNADASTLTQALAAAQRAITFSESHPLSHILLGNIYLWQRQDGLARGELERAIALGPTEAREYAGLAELLARMGRSEEALHMVEQALHQKKTFEADLHLHSVGMTYYLAGRPEEAIAPLKQYLTHYSDILGAHLTLAAVYSELGKEAAARAEAAEVLRLNPQFSLKVHKERTPIKDPATLDRHIAALRKAGLK
jgi:adenylate cyclase